MRAAPRPVFCHECGERRAVAADHHSPGGCWVALACGHRDRTLCLRATVRKHRECAR